MSQNSDESNPDTPVSTQPATQPATVEPATCMLPWWHDEEKDYSGADGHIWWYYVKLERHHPGSKRPKWTLLPESTLLHLIDKIPADLIAEFKIGQAYKFAPSFTRSFFWFFGFFFLAVSERWK